MTMQNEEIWQIILHSKSKMQCILNGTYKQRGREGRMMHVFCKAHKK